MFPKWKEYIFQPHICFWFPLTDGLKDVQPCIECTHSSMLRDGMWRGPTMYDLLYDYYYNHVFLIESSLWIG